MTGLCDMGGGKVKTVNGNKVGFIVYYDNPIFDKVDGADAFTADEVKRAVFWMRDYDMHGTSPDLDGEPVKLVKAWGAIERAMDIANDRYRDTSAKRSEAGRKGAAAKWGGNKDASMANVANMANAIDIANVANMAVTDTVTDTDSYKATSIKPVSTTCNVTLGSRGLNALKARAGEDVAIECPNCHGTMYGRWDDAARRPIAECMACGWSA